MVLPPRSPIGSSEPFRFSDDESTAKLDQRTWACPTRLVTDQVWASLWNPRGTSRGRGTVTAVLPLLALHTGPWKTTDELALLLRRVRPGSPKPKIPSDAGGSWTAWTGMDCRTVAGVCRVSTNALGHALEVLAEKGLAQRVVVPRPGRGGRGLTFYRIATSLYAANGEPFALIRGHLLYRGTWGMLPSHAARQLYIALACLDPIHDEEALTDAFEQSHVPDLDEEGDGAAALVAELREDRPLTVGNLVWASGMDASSVKRARSALLAPMHHAVARGGEWVGTEPLFLHGTCPKHGCIPWYSRNPATKDARFSADFLNNAEARRAYARRTFGAVAIEAQAEEDRAARAGRLARAA